MKILFLCLNPPCPPNDGGRIRTLNFMRYLAAEHSVTLVAFAPQDSYDDSWTPIREICTAMHLLPKPITGRPGLAERQKMLWQRRPAALRLYHSPSLSTLVRQLVYAGTYDLVHVDVPYMIPYVENLTGPAKIMDHMDVEAIKQRRQLLTDAKRFRPHWWLRWLEHFRWRSFEIRSLAWFDAHSAVSELDADYFRRYTGGAPVSVVPNGVDVDQLQPRRDPSSEPTLLYVGSMDYSPNADAVLWFAARVLPIIREAVPGVQFLIVGRNPPAEVLALARHPGVHVTGTVPDVHPYYESAYAMVVPLRIGGGTRLKILESMARGVPVVSTSVGAEGLDVTSGADLVTADTAKAFAAQTICLLSDRNLRMRLSLRARQTVEARYGWPSIGQRLVDVYHLAMAHHQGQISSSNRLT